jgi:hypothetical protein
MSVILERPLTVMWSVNAMLYVMMEVRPAEMKRIRSSGADIEGIPTYYAIEDDDVQWWPSCREGWPVLGYDR